MKLAFFKDMTTSEQKALFFILFMFVLGAILHLSGYTPPILKDQYDQSLLNDLLANDFILRYDLNKVTYDELNFIRGIGPATAIAIIEYRDSYGFKTVNDLLNIRGIGERRLAEFREYLFVELEENTLSEQVVNETVDITNSNSLININVASHSELMTLSGIGQKRASDIIAYRENNGGFKNIEDIKKVSGIGDVTFDNIKNLISVGN